jgi:methionine-gamma-lyase
LRGLDTLYPRIRTASANAQRLAGWLEAHPKITRVIYPGLPSHPQYTLAQAQMALPGGMIAFQASDPQAMSHQLADRLQIIHYAFSLGHQRSICVLIPTEDIQTSTFRMQGPALARYRDWAGDGLFRLSVGLEDAEDLIEDLARALG